MHEMSWIILIILAACLLPYVFTIIAKVAAGFVFKDNENPRAFLAKTTGLAARADAVQQNSFESLPLFIASILIAEYLVMPNSTILILGSAYLIFRVLYGLCYLANLATLRSIIWFMSMACPVLLLVICIKLL